MKSKMTIVALLTVLLAGISFAETINLTRDNFEEYTVDTLLPKAATAEHGLYSYGTGIQEVYVRTDPTDSGNKVAKIVKDAGSVSYLYSSYVGTAKTFNQMAADGLNMVFTYDIYVSNTNYYQSMVQLQKGGNADMATVYFVPPQETGSSTLKYYTPDAGTVTTTDSIAADAWYTMEYNVHQLVDDSWAVTLSATNKSTQVTTVFATDVGAGITDADVLSVARLTFYQYSTGEIYVDNISLSYVSVPEPLTVGVLVTGGTAMLAVRRRKR